MVKVPLTIKFILKCIGEDNFVGIQSYINEALKRNYIIFNSEDEFIVFFKDYLNEFLSNCTNKDIQYLYEYTGYGYKFINNIMRNSWNYEENGYLDDKVRQRWIDCAYEISDVFLKTPDVLPQDIKVYRGVSINSFREYGVSCLDDLKDLVGTYYYDSAFTSTSLLRDRSFFNRELDYHNFCNIEIEYMIPKECNDGIPLINEYMGYSATQCEFVINSGSLSKIVDVRVNEEEKKAYIKAILIPTKIWDRRFEKKSSGIKKQ